MSDLMKSWKNGVRGKFRRIDGGKVKFLRSSDGKIEKSEQACDCDHPGVCRTAEKCDCDCQDRETCDYKADQTKKIDEVIKALEARLV